jgi:four helix bundle protein
MQDFRKLRVWQAAREMTVVVYRTTSAFPAAERFGLVSQMRRAATSVGANIAEGAGRGSRADSKRCLQIAYGSACELLSHFYTASDLGFLKEVQVEELESMLEPVRRMLAGLMSRLK